MQESKPLLVQLCQVCKLVFRTKLRVCGTCKNVTYCSAVCQKTGWREHKLICRVDKRSSKSSHLLEAVVAIDRILVSMDDTITTQQRKFLRQLREKIRDINQGRSPLSLTKLEDLKEWRTPFQTKEFTPEIYWKSVIPSLAMDLSRKLGGLDFQKVDARVASEDDLICGIAFQSSKHPVIVGIGSPSFREIVSRTKQSTIIHLQTQEQVTTMVMQLASQRPYEEFAYNTHTCELKIGPGHLENWVPYM